MKRPNEVHKLTQGVDIWDFLDERFAPFDENSSHCLSFIAGLGLHFSFNFAVSLNLHPQQILHITLKVAY